MRIALATVGTTGDVRPFAALAPDLVAAGHSVTAISWDLHRVAFEGTGADFVAAGPATAWDEIRETAQRAAEARNPQQQVAVLRDFHLREAGAHYAALREALPGHDLVLLHGIHSLAEAAVLDARIPYATAVFDPVLLPTREHPPAGMPAMGPLNGVGWWLLDRMLSGIGRPLAAALRAAGSGSAGQVRLFRARSPRLHLVACSPALSPPPRDLPTSTIFTGAWVSSAAPDPLPGDVAAFLAAGPPPVVVSFGSMAMPDPQRLGDELAAALERARMRAIVQRGAADLALAASATLLPTGALDHRALLPRAVVFVHHGGAGTSHAAAAAGVPSVVVPHVGDQAYWADRLHRLGVAPEPLAAAKLEADALAARIQEAATSGAMRERAQQLAAAIGSEDGVAAAVQRLEAMARG
jgi:sterol 3beta-glucosyltransferase